jgi:hypothetical protein
MPLNLARRRQPSPLGLPSKTIAVTARNRSRFAPLKVRYPEQERPPYDVVLALELLGSTVEDPSSKRDLLLVLGEYRHALHALITTMLARTGPVTIGPATITVSIRKPGQQ